VSNYWIGDAVGRVLGPLSLQALRELIGSGRLKAVTRASRDGRTWEPIERFTEVKDLLGAARPDPAQQQQQADRLRLRLRSMQGLTLHQLFGVAPEASLEELRGAFFQLARRFAPENFGPETHPELRQAAAEVADFLARRMREAEARLASPPARPEPPRPVPTEPSLARPQALASRHAPARPAFTYAAHEFVGLQQRQDRLQVDIRVSARTAGIFTDHRVINLQAGGLFIPSEQPLPLGTRVELILHFERPARVLKLRSAVIFEYARDDGKQPRGYGLGLADLRAEERAFIDDFIRSARTAGALPPR
jgi:uncharacterized protein (TIGR02266 family)